MCFAKLFKKQPQKPPAPALTIPYPEWPPDYTKTVENVDVPGTVQQWLTSYNVPQQYWDFWKNSVVIKIDSNCPNAAQSWTDPNTGVRHLDAQPPYFNVGVLAHENAHQSYGLLSDYDKRQFTRAYTSLKATDPLIKLLYSKNTYGLTNDVEGHAELYRYLNEKMPEALKKFYPRLI